MEMILLLHARLPMTIASGTRKLKQVTYDADDSKLDRLCGASRQDRHVVNRPTRACTCITTRKLRQVLVSETQTPALP